jgi:hypothetical protein
MDEKIYSQEDLAELTAAERRSERDRLTEVFWARAEARGNVLAELRQRPA